MGPIPAEVRACVVPQGPAWLSSFRGFLNISKEHCRAELHFERPHQGPERDLWSGKCVLRSAPCKKKWWWEDVIFMPEPGWEQGYVCSDELDPGAPAICGGKKILQLAPAP